METRSPDFFVIQLHRHKKKTPTPPGPSYSSSAALRAAPREGAPEPPRWPAPLGSFPRPPGGAVRPPHRAPGEAARTAPHRRASPRLGSPRGPGNSAGQGELPHAPPRPSGAAPAVPGAGIPDRDPPRRFGEGEGGLPPRQGCALPAALPAPPGASCRARGARPHFCRSLALRRGKKPQARGAPRRPPKPVRKSPRHRVLRTELRRQRGCPRAQRRTGGAGVASDLGRALPLRDPASVSLVGAKSLRVWGLENGVPSPPGLALAARSAAPAAPPVGARGARGCSRCCRGEEKGSEGRCRECPAAPGQREAVVAAPRGAEPERCPLDPHAWHRRRHWRLRPLRSPALPRVTQPSAGKPSVTSGPLHPAPTPAAPRWGPGERLSPPSGVGGSAQGSRRWEGWRAGAEAPGVEAGGVSRGSRRQRAVPGPARSRRADKIKACQGVGAGGGAHTPPGREIPIVCRSYI